MLKDELQPLAALITGQVLPQPEQVEVACFEICNAWHQAVFSDAPEHSLRRYFHYHLEGIRQLSDTLFAAYGTAESKVILVMTELVGLINYQKEFFTHYFDEDAYAPEAYRLQKLRELEPVYFAFLNGLEQLAIDSALKECLAAYCGEMMRQQSDSLFTYSSLFYFERLMTALNAADPSHLFATLVELNFNDLAFFNCCRQQILEAAGAGPARTEHLKSELDKYKWLPEPSVACHPSWPSITVMVSGWLREEICIAETALHSDLAAANSFTGEKLSFNLSVAQLACLIRLFFEENLFNAGALTRIFSFAARFCQTKRQNHISPGSLSKEYYSVSQVTAAVVRDMLLRMAARINHNFFPVWAAISTIIYACSKSH